MFMHANDSKSVTNSCSPMDWVAYQAAWSMEFPRKEYANGEKFHIVDLSDPRIKPTCLFASPALVGGSLPLAPPWETPIKSADFMK